jgi:hypothetical protein
LALQNDGWYLRSDIIEEVELYCPCGCGFVLEERLWRWNTDRELIWCKPNALPESVSDRPTRCHEYIFLFSKAERYYYDATAIRERATSGASDVRVLPARVRDWRRPRLIAFSPTPDSGDWRSV